MMQLSAQGTQLWSHVPSGASSSFFSFSHTLCTATRQPSRADQQSGEPCIGAPHVSFSLSHARAQPLFSGMPSGACQLNWSAERVLFAPNFRLHFCIAIFKGANRFFPFTAICFVRDGKKKKCLSAVCNPGLRYAVGCVSWTGVHHRAK
jgi:hypothetical protein